MTETMPALGSAYKAGYPLTQSMYNLLFGIWTWKIYAAAEMPAVFSSKYCDHFIISSFLIFDAGFHKDLELFFYIF